MRCSHILGLLLAAALPVSAAAQDWTNTQQEVIDFAEGCWTTWAAEDWATYAEACPMDPDARYWDMNQGVPDYGHRSWQGFSEAMWPHMEASHYEHRPIAVQIFGDVVIGQGWNIGGNRELGVSADLQ